MSQAYIWQTNFRTRSPKLACEQLAFLTRGEKIYNPEKPMDILIQECLPYCNNDIDLQLLFKKVIYKCYGLDY